jgi:hypothetical protein
MNNFQTLFSRILVLPALVCGGQLMAQSMDGSFAIDYGSILINTPQNLVSEIDSTPETIYNQTGRAATPLSLTFTPNSAYRKKNVADYVRQVAKIAPDYAPKLDADLGDGQVFNQYSQMLDGIGLNANDLGDNLAVWWITAWEASQGRPVETPPIAFAKVQQQVQRVLAAESFTKMSNSDKQKFSDSLMIQTLILANQIDQAKSDPEISRQLAAGIKKGANQLGFDLESMTLTEEGFRPIKGRKTGAADSADKATNPAAEPTAVAANDTGNSNTRKWALIAAAAGAGLGGIFLFGKAMGKKG